MDGILFLGIATFLRNNRSEEAAYRSALNRAYYACFLATRKIAFANCDEAVRRRVGIVNERRIRHEDLEKYLKNSSSESVQRLGEDLAGLRGPRLEADYNMDMVIRSSEAKDGIDAAEGFLVALSQTDPSEIGRAMAAYIGLTHRPQCGA